MRAQIFKNNASLGELSFFADGRPDFLGDETTGKFIREAHKRGITVVRDIPVSEGRAIVEGPAEKDDSHYPLAFVEWLRRQGYEVLLEHPDVDEELLRLTEKLESDADGALLKGKIEEILRDANFLEKTFLLEQLRKRFAESR